MIVASCATSKVNFNETFVLNGRKTYPVIDGALWSNETDAMICSAEVN